LISNQTAPPATPQNFEELRERYRAVGAEFRVASREACRAREFSWELWRGMVAAGLLELVKDDPGRSLTNLGAALEGVAYGSRDGGFLIAPVAHCALGMHVVLQESDPEIRDHYVARLSTGDEVLAFAITEPTGGTDAFRPKTTLRSDGGMLILDGAKWHITSAPIAAMSIVWAADPACNDIVGVLVEHDWPGVEVSPPLRPGGTHSAPVGSLTFTSVEVPDTHLLGRGRGRSVLSSALVRERVLAGFAATGAVDAALRQALEFAVSRQVFGSPIATNQHIQRRLVDIKLKLDTMRSLAHAALAKAAAGERFVLEASQVKMYAARCAIEAALDAMQICGSYGLQEDAELLPLMLDGLCLTVAGGTEEAHRLVIMRELVKELLAGGAGGT
jgi:isovaleryl-CoA dehydrogenase